MNRSLRWIALLLFAAGLFALLPMVGAQDSAAASETTASAPAGISTLFLLIGLGAILLVGGAVFARENAREEVD